MLRCLCLAFLVACAHRAPGPTEVEKPVMKETKQVQNTDVGNLSEGTLDNGLRWAFARRPGTGVIALQAWIGVGSVHEKVGEEGMAHLHEHMLFKRTANLGPVISIDGWPTLVGR